MLQDLNGGHVGVVTYPSQDPLAKTLGSFQVDISDNPRWATCSTSCAGRGDDSLAGHGENRSGHGARRRETPGARRARTATQPLEKAFLNLVTERGIRSLELDEVDAIQLEDAGLQDELNRALAAVAGARDQDKKPVEIHFNGTGDRRVRLGYVVETPIWKASYRLVLPDAKDPMTKSPRARCKAGPSWITRPTTTGTTCA